MKRSEGTGRYDICSGDNCFGSDVYLSKQRVRLVGMTGFLDQGRVRIRVGVRVYVGFNISI